MAAVELFVDLVDVDLDVGLVDVDIDVDLVDVDLDVDLVVFLSSGGFYVFGPLGPQLFFRFLASGCFKVFAPRLYLNFWPLAVPAVFWAGCFSGFPVVAWAECSSISRVTLQR